MSVLALAVGVGPALAAGAGDRPAGSPGAADRPSGTGPSTPSAAPRTESPEAAPAGDFQGMHTMTGEVTRIDQKTGKLSVKTPEGMLDLHFPPTALTNVKKGDRVTVQLGIKEAAGGAASPPTGARPDTGATERPGRPPTPGGTTR